MHLFRAFNAGKLRTADCTAKGLVEAVVMSKKDFQELDNPLLAWMIDYDAVATVLKVWSSSKCIFQAQIACPKAYQAYERTHKTCIADKLCL